MRYVIALMAWTLLALLALAASRPAPVHGSPRDTALTNWSMTSQGFPAASDAGLTH
jgi:hypothetical protein